MGKKFVNIIIQGRKFKLCPQDIKKIHKSAQKILPILPAYNPLKKST